MSIRDFFKKIFSSETTGMIKDVQSVFDNLKFTEEEKAEHQLKIEAILTQRMQFLSAQVAKDLERSTEIIKAEMMQNDKFTKRARPSVVYVGLAIWIVNYSLLPIACQFLKIDYIPPEIPEVFVNTWKAVCSVWVTSRGIEKCFEIVQVNKQNTVRKLNKIISG